MPIGHRLPSIRPTRKIPPQTPGRRGNVVVLAPEKRTYPVEGRQTTEAAIHTTFRGDLYAVIGDAVADGGGYVTRIYFNPLVAWMWGGVTIMVARQGVRFIREATAERMASPHQ